MSVPGLPAGLRLTQLSRDHAADLTDLVRAKELTFFQRSETNTKEILGTLSAPNSTGLAGPPASGTTGACWPRNARLQRFAARAGLYLDLFISPHAPTAAVLRPHCSPPGSGTDKPCRRPMTPI